MRSSTALNSADEGSNNSAAITRNTMACLSCKPLRGLKNCASSFGAILAASSPVRLLAQVNTDAHDSPSRGLPFGLPDCPGLQAEGDGLRFVFVLAGFMASSFSATRIF